MKAGELWVLGNHRLLCGDSSKPSDVAKLMGGKVADVTFTSPPYNLGNQPAKSGTRLYGQAYNVQRRGIKSAYHGYSDDLPTEDYIRLCKTVLNLCFQYTHGFIFWNVNYNARNPYAYIAQIADHLPQLIEQVAWIKSSAMPVRGSLYRRWEPVYIFSTTGKNLGVIRVTANVWKIDNSRIANTKDISSNRASFPIGLPLTGIRLVRPETGIVFDPFGGTGTTLFASERLGRKCYMIEIVPEQCERIIHDWQKLTGKNAVKVD